MGRLLKASDVGKLFGVDKHTVCRWAHEGKIRHIKTPGGHYRFDAEYIARLIDASFYPEKGDV